MRAYGAYGEKTMYGRKVTGVIRSTVWIGPDGRVRRHWARVGNAALHPGKVLEGIRAGAPTQRGYMPPLPYDGSAHDRTQYPALLGPPEPPTRSTHRLLPALPSLALGVDQGDRRRPCGVVLPADLPGRGVPDSLRQHGEHPAHRRLPVRQQG